MERPHPQGGTALAAVCGGFTRAGEPCNARAAPGRKWCFNHDPDRRDERRRNASRAGKTKPNAELKELRELLKDLTAQVLSGEVRSSVGAVVCQITHARIKLVEIERRLREEEELAERIAALEAREAHDRTGRRW
jgi:hypothetical protein